MSKQKLTRGKLRKIIREEKARLREAEEVRGMQGSVEFSARGKGDYTLTVNSSGGSATAVLSRGQLDELMQAMSPPYR